MRGKIVDIGRGHFSQGFGGSLDFTLKDSLIDMGHVLATMYPTHLSVFGGGGFLRRVGLGDQGSLPAHFPQQSPCPLHPLALTGAWTGWRLARPLLLPRSFVLEKGEWAQDGRELLPVA